MIQNYKFLEVIGSGFQSKVYKAQNNNAYYAIKVIDTTRMSVTQSKLLQNEIEVLTTVKCHNMLKLIEVITQQNQLYIVTELCQFGSLEDQMQRGIMLTESSAIKFVNQLANAMQALKQHRFVHNDIKPSNIFISQSGYKLADFGFAMQMGQNLECNLGSPYYMAPETLAHNQHTHSSDIWALGVTLYQVTQGRLPFSAANEKDLLFQILNSPITFSKEPTKQFKKLIVWMLELQPAKRITVEGLLELMSGKENVKPQQPIRERSPLRTDKKGNTLSICQIARQLRNSLIKNELLAYALNGIILHYTNYQELRTKQDIQLFVDQKRVPDIFSMIQSDLLKYCLSQIMVSMKQMATILNKNVMTYHHMHQHQDEIVILANLSQLHNHLSSQSDQSITYISIIDQHAQYVSLINKILDYKL